MRPRTLLGFAGVRASPCRLDRVNVSPPDLHTRLHMIEREFCKARATTLEGVTNTHTTQTRSARSSDHGALNLRGRLLGVLQLAHLLAHLADQLVVRVIGLRELSLRALVVRFSALQLPARRLA